MPPFVGVRVELRREAAVAFRGYDRFDPCAGQRIAQPAGVEGAIREELTAGQPFDQGWGAPQVVRLSGQQAEVDHVAECVSQGHDLGGYAAARTSDGLALSPPFAP